MYNSIPSAYEISVLLRPGCSHFLGHPEHGVERVGPEQAVWRHHGVVRQVVTHHGSPSPPLPVQPVGYLLPLTGPLHDQVVHAAPTPRVHLHHQLDQAVALGIRYALLKGAGGELCLTHPHLQPTANRGGWWDGGMGIPA